LAIAIDPEFPSLAEELVFMGGSLNPSTDDPEFVNTPRREFNLWFDPEAAHSVLMASWKKVVCTTVDISVKTRLTQDLLDQVKASNSPAAQYVGKYARLHGQYNYVWDELAAAAWLDPSIITAKDKRYLDVDLNHGAAYGDTLSWGESDKPKIFGPPVEIQDDLDLQKFYKIFVALLSAPTPKS
jgi:inosine-uridine nucleoside N-ribohydrolase